jgi:hypothetical protein
MSIFNAPFNSNISDSLTIRQELMGKQTRTPKELTFLNSKTNWVSLKSGVDIDLDDGALAKANVLEGGTLSPDGKLKSGVTTGGNGGSYSNTNILGIKPMPGITSVSIENIGAYGSTRRATINFQCWDISQLEVLEQLYMRPGYLVLLEFGRTIYLEKDGSLQQTERKAYYDFFSKKNIVLLDELNALHKLAIDSKGNYDAFLGYIVNYGWQARPDGGYDCKTEMISTGEVLESLKANYSLATDINFSGVTDNNFKFQGKLIPGSGIKKVSSDDFTKINQDYSSNILAGLLRELHVLCYSLSPLPTDSNQLTTTINGESTIIDIAKLYYTSTEDPQYYSTIQHTSKQNFYITLESFIDLINKIIIPHVNSSEGNKSLGALTKLSVKDRKYIDGKNEAALKCLYNVLMTSVNPDVCFIKNEYWVNVIKGINMRQINAGVNVDVSPVLTQSPIVQLKTDMVDWVTILGNNTKSSRFVDYKDRLKVLDKIYAQYTNYVITNKSLTNDQFFQILQQAYQQVRGGVQTTTIEIPEVRGIGGEILKPKDTSIQKKRSWILISNEAFKKKLRDNFPYSELITNRELDNQFSDLFNDFADATNVNATGNRGELFTPNQRLIFDGIKNAKVDNTLDAELDTREERLRIATEQTKQIEETKSKLQKLGDDYQHILDSLFYSFVDSTSNRKQGIIGNIYLNIKYLYRLATDPGLTTQDPSGKNLLSLSQYITGLMKNVQSSIGNVNNFELHIDDRDGIGRIIDLNYISPDKLDNNFKFEIGSNKSIIRDLKLESKIFSDQVSMMAISAQAESGRLGYDNTTITTYNKGITNRLIPKINSPSVSNDNYVTENLVSSLSSLISLFFIPFVEEYFKNGEDDNVYGGVFNAEWTSSCQNYLRDIINFFTSFYNLDNANSMFLPAYLSFTIDGISGLIIGNIFSVDKTFIPKSYKNANKDLNYTIVKVNHELKENDWTTSIDAIPLPPSSELINVTIDNSNINFEVVIYYDPNTNKYQIDVGTSQFMTNASKNNIILKIYNTLKRYYNLTEEQASGIIGNAMAESGLNPTIEVPDPNRKNPLAKSGGLFQWNDTRFDTLKKEYPGENWKNPDNQLLFLIKEINSKYTKTINQIKNLSGDSNKIVSDSTFIWASQFERCRECIIENNIDRDGNLVYTPEIKKRIAFAQKALNVIKNPSNFINKNIQVL